MNIRSAKTIIYGLWLFFVAWLSLTGGGVFSDVTGTIGKKLFSDDLLPGYLDEIDFVLWTGFVCLLGWLPVLVRRDHWAAAFCAIGRDITFIILLIGSTMTGALLWQIIFADDFTPSVFVSPADMVKAGWSHLGAWCAWWGFIAAANVYSAVAATSFWKSRADGEPAIFDFKP